MALLAFMLLAAVPVGLIPTGSESRRGTSERAGGLSSATLADSRALEQDLARAVGEAGHFLDEVARAAGLQAGALAAAAARGGSDGWGADGSEDGATSGSDLVGGLPIGAPVAPPAPRVPEPVERGSRRALRSLQAAFQPMFDLTRTLQRVPSADAGEGRGELAVAGEPAAASAAPEPMPLRPGLLARDLRLDPATFLGGYGQVAAQPVLVPDATPDLGTERMRVPLLGGTTWSLGLRKLHADDRHGWVEESTSRGSDEELFAVFTLTLRF